MKTITTPQLNVSLQSLKRAEAEWIAEEQRLVKTRQRESAPILVLAANRNVALTTVQNKKRARLICRAQVATSKGGGFEGQETRSVHADTSPLEIVANSLGLLARSQ